MLPFVAVVLALLALPAPLTGFTQLVAETAAPDQSATEAIQAALRQVDEAADLDEPARAKARELYSHALEELELARTWRAKVERFTQMVALAPQELDQTRADLAAMPAVPELAIPGASLTELEQALSAKEIELTEQKASVAELESELRRRAGRRIEIPKLAGAAQERLAEVSRQLQAPLPAEPPAVAAARRTKLLARREALEQELVSYERELRAYEVRSELLSLRRDLAARKVAHLEQVLSEWRTRVTHQRYRETETQLRRARWEADRAHPALERLAAANAQWAERRKEMAELIAKTTRELDQTNDQLADLQDQFERMREKVDTVGLTNAIGLLLRKQRESLPNARDYWRRIGARQATIRDCQFELLQLKDRRSELANLDAQVERELRTVGRDLREADPAGLRDSVHGFLESERDYLDALIPDANGYFDRLVDLDNAERQLAGKTQEYSAYINERVLWIRSATALGAHDFQCLGEGLAWIARPGNWLESGRALKTDGQANPLIAAGALAVFGALFVWRRRLRARLSEIGDAASRAICCRIVPTLEAVVLTVLSAAAWPGLIGFVAWRLGADAADSEFIKAISAGLWSTAGVYLVLELLRQMLRENGLFDAHFDWPDSSLHTLRRQSRWVTLLVVPLVFLTVAMTFQESERGTASLGRVSFILVMSVCSFFVWRSLRAAGGVYKHIVASGQGEWLLRLRLVWYPMAVALPLVLAVLAATGYYYTAQQLAQRMIATAYILLGLTLLRSLLLRWVLVRRRKLAMEQARQRRAASQADEAAGNESGIIASIPTAPEPQADLATINMQTRHMVEYSLAVTGVLGIWLIWIDVLPALGFLNRVELWHAVEQARATTLADLGLSLLIFATTLIAAKNIPGLLEMLLLHHLPIDAGLRYTVGTVSRYVIIVIGVVLGCHSIGLSWVKVQWLIAAVSVGLGFGLQEIFANFVSGLIILFERPVRVGDVVTVSDVTGVISRIRMRATTITNWDRKEYIVPNKEFITGRLLNWTLSDQVNRLIVHVGIAYGSDTELAARLLAQAAEEHPRVLADPEPRVAFEEFGDSSLKFTLRCYLPDLEDRLTVIHDLHMSVDRKFRDAGIEIAFPQHDIHVRSIDSALKLFGGRRPKAAKPHRARGKSDDPADSRRVA
ncbi:MAG: mechanosensitive ion channel [Thermoguttaceae bacterium]|nr:mechanosensitive ion channel [Thermoguttaceae bacterium]